MQLHSAAFFLEICEEIEEKTGITMDIQPVTDFMDVIQVKLATKKFRIFCT